VADLDLAFGTTGLDFNQDPVQGIAEALQSPERLDEMLLDRLLTKCSEHLSIFAAPVVLDREYDISADACDLVIDIGAYMGEWATKIVERFDCHIIVIEPTPHILGFKHGTIINKAAHTHRGRLTFGAPSAMRP